MKWQCAWCGREYDSKDPPCETCGHEDFEPIEEGSASPFGSGSLVWLCPNCGREHVKHSPPCARCGNHTLEKREADDVDLSEDVTSPGYLSVGKPYLIGVVAVVGLVGLVLAGVIPLPGVSGPPAPPNAPGDADRSGELDLAAVEAELHGRLDDERAAVGAGERARGEGLDAYAEYATRHRVADRYDPDYGGSVPEFGAFNPRCSTAPTFGIAEPDVDVSAYEDETALAGAIADSLLSNDAVREAALDERRAEGVDIHVAPDGAVLVGYISC